MTMTLHVLRIDEYDASVREGFTLELLKTFLRQPNTGLEFVVVLDAQGEFLELTREGRLQAPRDESVVPLDEIPGKGSFAHWALGREPTDEGDQVPSYLAELLLPGSGWDLKALLQEPVVRELTGTRGPHFHWFDASDEVEQDWSDAWGHQGRSMVEAALLQNLVLRFC